MNEPITDVQAGKAQLSTRMMLPSPSIATLCRLTSNQTSEPLPSDSAILTAICLVSLTFVRPATSYFMPSDFGVDSVIAYPFYFVD